MKYTWLTSCLREVCSYRDLGAGGMWFQPLPGSGWNHIPPALRYNTTKTYQACTPKNKNGNYMYWSTPPKLLGNYRPGGWRSKPT